MSELIDIISDEREQLRTELQSLKKCQVLYFTLSVSATGALLGLPSKVGPCLVPPLYYLAPLVIVLPCWWIFFDKATSITRMVAYMRILERMLMSLANRQQAGYRYVGFESALSEFRKNEDRIREGLEALAAADNTPTPSVTFRGTRYRYWIVNWCTFFGLSAICNIVAVERADSLNLLGPTLVEGAILLSALAAAVTTVVTLLLARHLMFPGKHSCSYDKYTQIWERVLRPNLVG